jgi:purine-binding chemotaxis protein CheW
MVRFGGNDTMLQLLFWRVGLQEFALPVSAVSQVVRAVALTAVRSAPPFVCGAVNIRGLMVPVVDVRRRFRLPERPLALTDHFIIARTPRAPLALWVDAALGVADYEGEVPAATPAGWAALPSGTVLMQDLERCLAADGERPIGETPR